MLINVPPTYRKRRLLEPGKAAGALPVSPLLLTAATYSSADYFLLLSFDRAVDAAGIVGSEIVVTDPLENVLTFFATGTVTMLSPTEIKIELEPYSSAAGENITLNASAGNGIVAADDGGAWAGASELVLPWP